MKTTPLAQLQVFLAVARMRSFSGAARNAGVSRAAVSQAVRQLEEQLRVVLLNRTTRSVSLTDAGRRLMEEAGPGLGQALAALSNVSVQPGQAVGRVRLSAPRMAVPFVITPVLPTFRARHPRVEVEVVVEDRFVDIVAENYDAGVRLTEAIERDMVQVRITDAFRFVVVGAPSYLERHGTPRKPEDLLRHECLTFRLPTTGALYASHADYVAAGEAAGLTPLYAAVSSDQDWDEYAWRYSTAVETYAAAKPEDPEAQAMRARIVGWRRLYLAEGRRVMGFGLYLFAKS